MEHEAPPALPSLASVAVTLCFWVFFVVTVVPGFFLAILLWLVTAPFDRDRALLHRFVCGWMFQYLKAWPGWRVVLKGRSRLPKGPCVLVANHQSVSDVLACMGLGYQFKFVSKASLFAVPLVGHVMRMLQYVRVERGRPRSMRRMVEDSRAWLKKGVPVLIFPEGTYATPRELLPFKRGAFKLAIEEQVPLVPVGLSGTHQFILGDGPWMSPRANIEIEVLEPIAPQELGTDEKALADRARALLAQAVGRGA